MFDERILPPMVVVSFSSGRISYYHGTWETFVTEELPLWASKKYGSSYFDDGYFYGGLWKSKDWFKEP